MNRLDAFNCADEFSATAALRGCCASRRWAKAVAAKRPFESFDALIERARSTWANATESDQLEAFAAHPLIGDVELLKKRFATSAGADRANVEQGQVLDAQTDTIDELAKLNIAYRARHGFIFIVYAADKSAEEMLGLLKSRIDRATDVERETAAAEQMKITELRLTQLMSDEPGEPRMTQFSLSTHVLDLDSGQPAEGLLVALANADGELIGQVATDTDGRITTWPGVDHLEGGTYSLVFEVSVWYAEREQSCFYPEVRVEFIADEARHYHVPLLLNRFGYSTYRGS